MKDFGQKCSAWKNFDRSLNLGSSWKRFMDGKTPKIWIKDLSRNSEIWVLSHTNCGERNMLLMWQIKPYFYKIQSNFLNMSKISSAIQKFPRTLSTPFSMSVNTGSSCANCVFAGENPDKILSILCKIFGKSFENLILQHLC